MKKTLSTVLIANLVFLYPSLECSQAFAGMNAEGKSFDLNAVPDANFSLQTPFNLDLPNEIPGIAASLGNANDIIKEIKLGTPNLSPELNFIGREFSPIVRTSKKTAASNQSPINAATPLRHPSANSSFLKAEHFVSDEIKAWETPKALTAAGLNLNFDNNANKDSSFVPQENNSEGGVFQTEIDPKTFPAPFNNSEMLAFIQDKINLILNNKTEAQTVAPVSNPESFPNANVTPRFRQGINLTVYDINGNLWLKKTTVVTPSNQPLWYNLGPKPTAFPRTVLAAPKTFVDPFMSGRVPLNSRSLNTQVPMPPNHFDSSSRVSFLNANTPQPQMPNNPAPQKQDLSWSRFFAGINAAAIDAIVAAAGIIPFVLYYAPQAYWYGYQALWNDKTIGLRYKLGGSVLLLPIVPLAVAIAPVAGSIYGIAKGFSKGSSDGFISALKDSANIIREIKNYFHDSKKYVEDNIKAEKAASRPQHVSDIALVALAKGLSGSLTSLLSFPIPAFLTILVQSNRVFYYGMKALWQARSLGFRYKLAISILFPISYVLLNVLALPAAAIAALIMGFIKGQKSGPKSAFKTGWENVKTLNNLINESVSGFKQGQAPRL